MAETVVVSMKIALPSAPDKELKSAAIPFPDDAAGRITAEAMAIAEVINKASEGHGINRSSFLAQVKTCLTHVSQ
jgi:hypothetical protein